MKYLLSFYGLMLSLLLAKLAVTAPASPRMPEPGPEFADQLVPEYIAHSIPPVCHAPSSPLTIKSMSTTMPTSTYKPSSKLMSPWTSELAPKSKFTIKSLLISTPTTIPKFTPKPWSKYMTSSKSSSISKASPTFTSTAVSISTHRVTPKSTPIFLPTSIASLKSTLFTFTSTPSTSATIISKSTSTTKSLFSIPTKLLSTSLSRPTPSYISKSTSKSSSSATSTSSFVSSPISASRSSTTSLSSSASSSSISTTSSAFSSTIIALITSTFVSTLPTKLIPTSSFAAPSTTELVSSSASSFTTTLLSLSTFSSKTELVSLNTSSSTIELASSSTTLTPSSSLFSAASSSTTSFASPITSSTESSATSSITTELASSTASSSASSPTTSPASLSTSSSTIEPVSSTASPSITGSASSSTFPSSTSPASLSASVSSFSSTTEPVSSSNATFTTTSTTSASYSDTTSVTSSSVPSDTTSATLNSTFVTKQISTSSPTSSSSSPSVSSGSTLATTSFTSTLTSTPTSTSVTLVSSTAVIDRATWVDGFTVGTDYELSTPSGGSRSYNFEVTEHYNWVGPDGVVKDYVQLVNGQLPGPTLYAEWGDTITVTVTNSLPANGTGFHWHGLRQFETNIQDGANGVTECPLAPNKTRTYTLHATQYGTSWYHSHFSAQYGNGVYGTIHIDGPASANYDVDLGVYPISDYYYSDVDALIVATSTAPPPASDNILFNGTNIDPTDPSKGNYSVVTLTPGNVHRLRLVNPSVENHYQVSLVGHEFTIIATDFVPVEPVVVSDIFIGVGQRYDVLINATEAVDNYWFNVTLGTSGLCGASKNPSPAAIFRYAGAPDALPTATGTVPADAGCQDATNYVPVVTRTADVNALLTDTADPTHELDISLFVNTTFVWEVNSSAVNVQWDKPVLQYVIDGNTSYPQAENLVFVDEQNVWTYWVIQNLSPLPHPMHLHGHDYLILGSVANANFSSSDSSTLNFNNPARRDVTMLPANGYLILAFMADNPGNWLFHCHIAWHVSGGLSADFMESRDKQLALISDADLAQYNQVCEWWQEWEPSAPPKIDSGLRR